MGLTRVLETSFALSIVRERIVKNPLSLPPWGEGVMCNRGGHKREKCVHEYSVMCIFHQCHSVTVSQRGCRESTVKSTAGQGTSAYCRLREGGSTVKSLQ